MALLAAAGKLTLGNMTLYVMAFRQGQQAFQSALGGIGGMYEHNLYMSNLFEYLEPSPAHGRRRVARRGRSRGTGGSASGEQGHRARGRRLPVSRARTRGRCAHVTLVDPARARAWRSSARTAPARRRS